MTLNDLKPGESGKVIGIGQTGNVKKRIMDMGITTGINITVVKRAPLGDPIEIKLRGYGLSIRKSEAGQIEIG